MKWVTREYVHLDRVASPWLIKRFIDKDAEFCFVPWGQEGSAPADATPLALPGAELAPHGGAGTTFQQIVNKYAMTDPAIARMARVVALGVDYFLHDYRPAPDDVDGQTAVGLLEIAEGMLVSYTRDEDIIAASLGIYDALYLNFRAHALVHDQGLTVPARDVGPGKPIDFFRALLKAEGRNGV
jgi:hypothetical protein